MRRITQIICADRCRCQDGEKCEHRFEDEAQQILDLIKQEKAKDNGRV